MTVLVALGFVLVGVLAYVVLRNAQDFSDANEVVPGVATKAPKSWAGAHTPEARMHRRLRDAVLAMQANASLDAPEMAEVRRDLEQQALAVDERLIAVAALSKSHREEPLRQVDKAVHAIESAVASVVDLRGPSLEAVEAGIEAVQARMMLVESARVELEAMSPTSRSLEALRAELEATEPPVASTEERLATPDPSPDPTPAPDPGSDPDADDGTGA